jgi:hypothetical protein
MCPGLTVCITCTSTASMSASVAVSRRLSTIFTAHSLASTLLTARFTVAYPPLCGGSEGCPGNERKAWGGVRVVTTTIAAFRVVMGPNHGPPPARPRSVLHPTLR